MHEFFHFNLHSDIEMYMTTNKENALVISEHDYERLLPLAEKHKTPAAEALDVELARADIVANVDFPADAVSMDSIVTFVDLDSGENTTVSLVYPLDASVDQMKISILSPVGSALIGLRIGGHIDWPMPQGKLRRLKVINVIQPEPVARSR